MTEVSRLKKSRSANRNALSGLITKCKQEISKNEDDVVKAKYMLVQSKFKVINISMREEPPFFFKHN